MLSSDSRRDSRCLAGTDQVALGTCAEQEVDGIDDDRFSGTGFAGQNRKAGLQFNIRLTDNGDIFNV